MKPLNPEAWYEAQTRFAQQLKQYLKQHQLGDSQFQWGEVQSEQNAIIIAIELCKTKILTLKHIELEAFLPHCQNANRQRAILQQKAFELANQQQSI